jgi:phosphatidylinositol glycan class Q protein
MKSRPAGVKLNPSLASFLGQVLLIYVQWWLNVMSELGNHILVLFGLLLSFSLGGLSLTFALLVDIIMLHCCHILWLYSVLARIYHLQFSLLLSLWFLFRGKKWNVLKQRLDSCDYSIDQLLLGTLLFTILFFLLPTTWAFYLYFLIAYALVLVIHTLTCIVLELCNHFPFYSLFQYLFMKNTFLGSYNMTMFSHNVHLPTQNQHNISSSISSYA